MNTLLNLKHSLQLARRGLNVSLFYPKGPYSISILQSLVDTEHFLKIDFPESFPIRSELQNKRLCILFFFAPKLGKQCPNEK